MQIPLEWLAEAGLHNFIPVRTSIRYNGTHTLIALADIERLLRSVPLDANDFRRCKMMPVLEGIRDDCPFLPIQVAKQWGQRPYNLRDGVHRYYASLTLGFTHVPAEIIDQY